MAAELVGRDQELDSLSMWLGEARAGDGRLVLVGGEAGIGKSRLIAALAERAATAAIRTVEGRTTELDGAPAYWPWLQVLEQLGARSLLESPAGKDPESERFARFEAVIAAITDAADGQPLIVVLEDVHRAESASLRLLAHVGAARARASPPRRDASLGPRR